MKFFEKHPGVLVALGLWVIYGLSAARGMTGFGDSDELIAAGYSLALPHPSGYPLLTLMIYGVTRLPLINPGHLAHLLGAVIMAVAVGLSVEILNLIIKTKKWWYLVLTGVMVGSSKLVWEHGAHLEVFGLLSFFSMGLLGISWMLGEEKANKRFSGFMIWGLIVGLGLGHHQLMLLSIIPLLGYLMMVKRPNKNNCKHWLSLVVMTGVGLIISLGLLWMIGRIGSVDSWKFEPTITGIINFFMRADYRGYSVENGQMNAYISQVELSSVIASMGHYVTQMWSYWGVFSILGLVGLVMGKKVGGRIYWPILGGFILSGPLLAGYISLPGYPSNSVEYIIGIATLERMYVLSQLWWGLLVGMGLVWLVKQKWANWWLDIVLAVAIIINIFNVFPARSLANYTMAEVYVTELFSDLPSNSSLICLSDLSCFGGFYYQSVLGQRTDVGLISSASQFRWGTHSAWKYGGFDYEDNPFRLGEAIGRATLQKQPIFIAQLNAIWTDVLGLNGQAFYLVPNDNFSFGISRNMTAVSLPSNSSQEIYHQLVNQNQPDYKYVEVIMAVLTEQNLINDYVISHPIEIEINDKEILAEVNQRWNDGDMEGEIKYAQWLVWRNPDNLGYRKTLAEAFNRAGLTILAKRESLIAETISQPAFQYPDQNPR